MNIPATANAIYHAIKDNAPAIAQLRTEFAALGLSLATDPNASKRITSATINGQTFTASDSITAPQRFALLRWVIACIDNQSPISKTQISTF